MPPALLSVSMKVEFAPINIPLKRRIQTVAVLQWIFSFLLLGNSLPPPCPCPREKRARSGVFRDQRYPWASLGASPWLHVGAAGAGGEQLPGDPRAGKSISLLSSLKALGGFSSFLGGLFLSMGSPSNIILKG